MNYISKWTKNHDLGSVLLGKKEEKPHLPMCLDATDNLPVCNNDTKNGQTFSVPLAPIPIDTRLEFTYTLFYTPPLPEVADETQKRIWRQNEFPIGVFQVFHLAMKE